MPKANHKNLGDHLHQKNTVSVFLITTPAVLFVFGLFFVCVCVSLESESDAMLHLMDS